MNNLSFEELKSLSISVADSTLLEKISGGNANDCHDKPDEYYEIGPGACH